ncbi:MAG: glycosyltransferase involved in cell wall biosynthesis [Granulosicoccus sp.]|jgi:glycosyltransferase involved in cell wall biosynthesis
MTQQSFDVVIPCYNPKAGWAKHLINSLKELNQATPEFKLDKLIVVNDGSPDGFKSEMGDLETEEWQLQIIEHTINKGKGAAIRSGLGKSQAAVSMFTDVDVPYRVEDMAIMIKTVGNGNVDLALGTRGESYYSTLSTFRRLISKGLLRLNKSLFNLKIGDTQGGLKAMNEVGRNVVLDTTIDRYLFDLETVRSASKKSLRIIGVEVRLQSGIQLPGLGLRILIQESGNLLKLLFSR